VLEKASNQNQNEFSKRQVHIPENVSMTLLKITERHHNYPQRGWGNGIKRMVQKTGQPLTKNQ